MNIKRHPELTTIPVIPSYIIDHWNTQAYEEKLNEIR